MGGELDLLLAYFKISYLTVMNQLLYNQCALTLLIWKTFDFWSPSFLVFLACKHKKLLFQKWDDLGVYWICSSFHLQQQIFHLQLQPQ